MRYRVYCDDSLISDTYIPNVSMHLIDPKLELADCSAGTFEFTITSANPGYSLIQRMISRIIVMEDNNVLWTGRVVTESEDFWKRRKFTCEGAMAYLNDTLTEITSYDNFTITSFLRQMLSIHNLRVDESPAKWAFKKILLGRVIGDDPDAYSYKYETSNESVWESIKKHLIDRLGGHLSIRYVNSNGSYITYLDYSLDTYNTTSQVINFGENLLDFTKNWDLTNLTTVILPRGKQLDTEDENGLKQYVTVETALAAENSMFIRNETAYAKYGRIEKIVDFSDIEDPNELFKLGRAYLTSQQFDDMKLEVSAVDLKHISPGIQKLSLLDEVNVVSRPHGLDRMFPISAISYNLEKPSDTKYTLGNDGSMSLSKSIVSSDASVSAKINSLPMFPTLDQAKAEASSILNRRTNGYVNIIEQAQHSQALIISNNLNWQTTGTKYWKFDMNGLGYYNGVKKDSSGNPIFDLAITMDGSIVADRIKTGLLSDAAGKNYWNLLTGEFSLNANSEIIKKTGSSSTSVGTILDVYDLANSAEDYAITANNTANSAKTTANTANSTANTAKSTANTANATANTANATANTANATANAASTYAKNISVGGVNVLNGTDKYTGWSKTSNFSYSGGTAVCKAPSTANSKTWLLSRLKDLTYGDIKGQKMVLSFEFLTASAWGAVSATNKFVVSFDLCDSANHRIAWKLYTCNTKNLAANTWQRQILKIQLKDANFTKNKSFSSIAITKGLYFRVRFFNISRKKIQIRKIQLERGTIPTDWSKSKWDIENDATVKSNSSYTKSVKFSQNQRKALDESFNQNKVLTRLTNNGKSKGIYLKSGQLYMNATYIKSGTLDAGIVKAGILTDKKQRFYWNMVTGALQASYMKAYDLDATGSLTAGSYYKMELTGGCLNGYMGNDLISVLSPTSSVYVESKRRTLYGLTIKTPHLAIQTDVTGVATNTSGSDLQQCWSGTIRLDNIVANLREKSFGIYDWGGGNLYLHVKNGLIVGAYGGDWR